MGSRKLLQEELTCSVAGSSPLGNMFIVAITNTFMARVNQKFKEAAMPPSEINCCFCDTRGTTVLDPWDSHTPLLLCIFPHYRKGPKVYACRKCIRLKWRLSDKDFSAEVLKVTQGKPVSSAAKSATSRRGSKNP